MKKIIVMLLAVLLVVSCSDTKHKDGNLIVKGNVKGLRLGTLLIKQFKNDSLVTLDSIKVDGNEKFEFYTSIDEPQMMMLELPEIKDGRILFFAEPQDTVKIFTYLESFGINPQVSAGKNQEKREEYQNIIKKFNNQKLDLFQAQFKAAKNKQTAVADSLEKKLNRLERRRILYTLNFVFTNRDKSISPYVAMMEFYDNPKALDTIYKILPENLRNSVYGKEIKKMLDK